MFSYSFNKTDAYIIGYFRGAESLSEECLKEEGSKDYLIYPILFLYRHFIELSLKNIIEEMCTVAEIEKPPLTREHRITVILQDFEKIYTEICKEMKDLRRCVNEYAKIDPDSTRFRYAKDQNGKETVHLKYIDLKRTQGSLKNIEKIFDMFGEQIHQWKDYFHDVRRA